MNIDDFPFNEFLEGEEGKVKIPVLVDKLSKFVLLGKERIGRKEARFMEEVLKVCIEIGIVEEIRGKKTEVRWNGYKYKAGHRFYFNMWGHVTVAHDGATIGFALMDMPELTL